jgi:uncharacterized protein (TIGR02594 family)
MKKIEITALELAQRFVGLKEVEGKVANPQILAMLQLDNSWPQDDDVPWCSAFVNYICWLLRLPRSKSLMARSWLNVGMPIDLDATEPGFSIIILKRGGLNSPGPDVLDAPGHVGFYAGKIPGQINVLGGNQGDCVSVMSFPWCQLLGVRALLI